HARQRAAATARSLVRMQTWTLAGPRLFAPTVEVVDHRILGTWSARGEAETLRHLRAVLALADNVATCWDDLLGLRADALLVRGTHSGTDRASGGAYERQFLMLLAFAPDGLVARQEYFDADRTAEALARFDALAGAVGVDGGSVNETVAARFANAAT